MTTLKDRYLPVCDRLIRKIGTAPVSYQVPKDATLKQCVYYLEQHIVHDRTHFRYKRYSRMVDHYFNKHFGGSGKGRRPPLIVHVDLGMGPGVFNWVVHDRVQQNWKPKRRPRLVQFGYDRCPAMVELAERIWTRFELNDEVQFLDSRKALRRAVGATPENACLLITFGHVLIQSYDADRSAVSSLAKLCNRLAQGKDTAAVLAVDAYSYGRSQEFESAARHLCRRLRDSSDRTAGRRWERARVPAKVLPEGSRAILSLRRQR